MPVDDGHHRARTAKRRKPSMMTTTTSTTCADVAALVSNRAGNRSSDVSCVKTWVMAALDGSPVMDETTGLDPNQRRVVDVLFTYALKHTHRVIFAAFGRADVEMQGRFARDVARRGVEALTASADDTDDDDDGWECLRACAVMCGIFSSNPQSAFENQVIALVNVQVLMKALTKGLSRVGASERRASPECVDLLTDCCSLAYDVLTFIDDDNDDGGTDSVSSSRDGLIRALMNMLNLERSPSRDAMVTAGVTVARAMVDGRRRSARSSIESFASVLYGRTFPTSAQSGDDGDEKASYAAEACAFSPFGALAVVRGFIIASDARALASPLRDDSPYVFMYDDVLPGICQAIEDAEDSHYRFHAAACLRSALEKTRAATMTSSAMTCAAAPPPPDQTLDRVAWIISMHWDDPLGQTVREMQACFECVLDITARYDRDNDDAFLRRVLCQILSRRVEQKGRYLALRALLPRIAAATTMPSLTQWMIDEDVLRHTLLAMSETSIAPAASAMLGDAFATSLDESRHDVDGWRRWWMRDVVYIFERGTARARSALVTYVLPTLFKLDPCSSIDVVKNVINDAAAVVGVLKTCRSARMVDDERVSIIKPHASGDGVDDEASTTYEVPIEILHDACVSASTQLRLDVLELVCLDARRGAVTFPGALELHLIRRMLPLNLRGETVSFRGTMVTLMSKFLTRTWTCVNQVAQKCRRRGHAEQKRKTLAKRRGDEEDPLAQDIARAQQCHAWVSELVTVLVMSMYPGAPFERRCTALDLLNVVAEAWGQIAEEKVEVENLGLNDDLRIARDLLKSPYQKCMGQACTELLLGALVDSWEKVRVTAFALLRRHPSPLAGLETPERLEARLAWAMDLLHSPRLRESDAAALLIRLLIRKYAFDLRWDIQLSPTIKVTLPLADGVKKRADVGARVLESLCDLLAHDITCAEDDVVKACRQSLAHGAILLTRYALHEIDFVTERTDALQTAMTRMMALMARATDVALGFISQPDALGATAEEVKLMSGDDIGDDMDDDMDALVVDATDACDLAPRAQIITTACWLTVKEISLLTGEVTGAPATADIFSLDALKSAGERLFNVLFSVKHTGAMEKTRLGTTALCARLMRSSDAALNMLPQQWLDELVAQLKRPGQGIRDRVRRSAGLPYAFMSILLAEPKGQTRTALERVLPQLLDIASASESDGESENIPRVHAFNVVRVIFADRDLSVETTAHAARGVEVCIRAFSSPAWETRNAATLAFASLLTKVCGYMNTSPRRIRDGHAASRREVSVVEFFQRFPSLHAYLLEELGNATSMMASESSSSVSSVHPSLYPTLALLSRLIPSSSSYGEDDTYAVADGKKLSPTAFIPNVLTCASTKYLAVRAAAARALRPLVPSAEVAGCVASILLPLSDKCETPTRVGCNTTHGALLCVHELLTEACCSSASASSVEMVRDIVREASKGLTACAKKAATVRVPLISGAWLRCAEATALIANTFLVECDTRSAPNDDDDAFHELMLMMWQCSAPVLAACAEGHPGASEWYKAAAGVRVRLALNCDSAYHEYRYGRLCKTHDAWVGDNIGDVREAIIAALGEDTPYEYRAEVYKAMFHGGKYLPLVSQLRDFVLQSLQREHRHSVVRRALRVVSDWAGGMSDDANGLSHFWRVVLHITTNNINERVRSEGLRCLARLCSAQLSTDAEETVSSGHLDGFVRLILNGCDPSTSSETRKAAVEALSGSKLLEYIQGSRVRDEATAELALNLWRCVLMLIEDEDVDIREMASDSASSAIQSVRMGAQSEQVLRAAFQHIHTHFGRFAAVNAYMVELAKGPSYTRAQFDHVLAQSTNIRRLFDKEADNAHAEPLFLAQLAAKQIHASCDATTAQVAFDETLNTLTHIKDSLDAFASRNSRWVGGVTAHEDCFVPIANALIGAWAFEARIGDDKKRRERLREQYNALDPFVAPALRVLMRGIDEGCGSNVDEDDVFATVSPCFLV